MYYILTSHFNKVPFSTLNTCYLCLCLLALNVIFVFNECFKRLSDLPLCFKWVFLRLLVKHNALQLPFLPSSRLIQDVGIVNWYFWFWKSLNMADKVGEFSFLQGIHIRTYKRIYTFISIRSMAIKFGRLVHLEELRQMKLIKQVLVTPSRRNHVALKRC